MCCEHHCWMANVDAKHTLIHTIEMLMPAQSMFRHYATRIRSRHYGSPSAAHSLHAPHRAKAYQPWWGRCHRCRRRKQRFPCLPWVGRTHAEPARQRTAITGIDEECQEVSRHSTGGLAGGSGKNKSHWWGDDDERRLEHKDGDDRGLGLGRTRCGWGAWRV